MPNAFFEKPILNSPYQAPDQYWELDESGQPTHAVKQGRRPAEYIVPIPKSKRQTKAPQKAMVFDEGKGISREGDEYDPTPIINQLRRRVEEWRRNPNQSAWGVTPETARLLHHWRQHEFNNVRPFFCQIEAVETLIWLTEVAPSSVTGKLFLDHIEKANAASNPDLLRIALKLATGAGKTTVMAMIIAWQTINAVRHPQSKRFSRGFLIVSPGITIKDRLRVLQPNDPDSYYAQRELIPPDMLADVLRARIVITNYHAFKLRERIEISAGGRKLLKGRTGDDIQTLESEGQMLQRVIPELMSLKSVLVLNDEAHHCYREKQGDLEEELLKGDDKQEAEENKKAARLWISGLEAVKRNLGDPRIVDLSATPFFLRGSGYAEGTLFPWTMSDFSLMDAIECGIVKLPRVPVADNIPDSDAPMFRKLWDHISAKMPKKARDNSEPLDPRSLPPQLQTALEALYGHYAKTHALWVEYGIDVPPCFIIICSNTAASKLVYDFVSGYYVDTPDGRTTQNGAYELFRNFDEHLNPLPSPRTLLIDSKQLESGDALDDNFRKAAADEIARFKREILERGGKLAGELQAGKELDDATILREVMNTVGKAGQLGASIRCIVSVSMLTEGWDANTVTHVLGVRAFGTQLLCEQVIGRALRRQSYQLNDKDRFNVEYADVLGIPFDFAAKPVVSPPQPPRETIRVQAVRPERDALEIRFPRVAGYTVELPTERLEAKYNDESKLVLTPDLIGATITQNAAIIGQPVDLTLAHTGDVRPSQVLYELTSHLLSTRWQDEYGQPRLNLFGQLKRVAREWLETYLECKGGTYPAQLKYKMLADMACERINAGITTHFMGSRPVVAVLDPYNPTGSTNHVNFNTSKTDRWLTDARKCHVNWVILDSGWESEFCRIVESHPRVHSYVKNHGLGLEVPYRFGSEMRKYLPDFIVRVEDGQGEEDLLNLIVEIKGYRKEDAIVKKSTMNTYWIPGVNNLAHYGRWAFAELTELYEMLPNFEEQLSADFDKIIDAIGSGKR